MTFSLAFISNRRERGTSSPPRAATALDRLDELRLGRLERLEGVEQRIEHDGRDEHQEHDDRHRQQPEVEPPAGRGCAARSRTGRAASAPRSPSSRAVPWSSRRATSPSPGPRARTRASRAGRYTSTGSETSAIASSRSGTNTSACTARRRLTRSARSRRARGDAELEQRDRNRDAEDERDERQHDADPVERLGLRQLVGRELVLADGLLPCESDGSGEQQCGQVRKSHAGQDTSFGGGWMVCHATGRRGTMVRADWPGKSGARHALPLARLRARPRGSDPCPRAELGPGAVARRGPPAPPHRPARPGRLGGTPAA